MSYAWLFGLLVGIAAGVGVVLFGWLGGRKFSKKRVQEADERTKALHTEALATSFYLTVGFAALGWLYQIADGYLTGAEPPIITPFSIMLAAMLFIYFGANLYQTWRHQLWSELDEQEKEQMQKKAGGLLGGLGAAGISASLAFKQGANAIGWFLLALLLIQVGVASLMLAKAKARKE